MSEEKDRYIDDLLGRWSTWIWMRNFGHALAIKPSSAYTLVGGGGHSDSAGPVADMDVLRFQKLYDGHLMLPAHKEVICYHYTHRGSVNNKIQVMQISRTEYFDRLSGAKASIGHFMRLPSTAW